MRLIIDSGSTKMEWILLDRSVVKQRFLTEGFNPNYSENQSLDSIISSVVTRYGEYLSNKGSFSIHYYGTGCGNQQNCQSIKEVFLLHFPHADIHVTHDLMAACHALLGNEKGIACILGTGSNSCAYDGKEITERAVSLGYLLGDEGSGMHIGKEMLRTYFYGSMPADLREQFDATYHLELKDFIHQLYHGEQPSKYLASFARFAGEYQSHPYVHTLVKGCFDAFVESFLLRFDQSESMKISFVGSVAYHFRDILTESLAGYGLTLGEVMQTPSEGLIRYYQSLPG